MFKSVIHRRAMAVIKGKIAEAQKKYEARLETREKIHEASIKDLEEALELDKVALIEEHVCMVLGKFL